VAVERVGCDWGEGKDEMERRLLIGRVVQPKGRNTLLIGSLLLLTVVNEIFPHYRLAITGQWSSMFRDRS
jgi:hypothetical protein